MFVCVCVCVCVCACVFFVRDALSWRVRRCLGSCRLCCSVQQCKRYRGSRGATPKWLRPAPPGIKQQLARPSSATACHPNVVACSMRALTNSECWWRSMGVDRQVACIVEFCDYRQGCAKPFCAGWIEESCFWLYALYPTSHGEGGALGMQMLTSQWWSPIAPRALARWERLAETSNLPPCLE